VLGKAKQVVKSGRAKTSNDSDSGAKKKKCSEVYKVATKCEDITKGVLSHYESFAVRTLEGFLPTPAMSDLGRSPTSLTQFAFLIAHIQACPKDFRASLPHHIDTGGERRRVGSAAS
jgi:hypothetical protein